MKEKIEIVTTRAPSAAGAYSQGLVFGDLVFVAGQRPADPATGLVPGDFTAQTRQVFRNVQAILEAGGSSVDRVLKVTVYLTNLNHWSTMNDVYLEFFRPPLPVRTTIGVALRGILIEVDAIAHKA